MRKNFSLALSLLAAVVFTACGDDSSSVSPNDTNSEVSESSSSATTKASKSSNSAKSSASAKSSNSAKSSGSAKSSASAKSSNSAKSSGSAKSSASAKSSDSAKSIESEKSSASAKSSNSAKSSDSKTSSSSSVLAENPASSSSVVPGSSSSDRFGSMTDERDGHVYKTVTIGKKTWMAENLNFDPGDVSDKWSGAAWHGCFGDNPDNCTKYGRLYDWLVAVNEENCNYEESCKPSVPVQGLCPEGWHLPSADEWESLFVTVGGKKNETLFTTSGVSKILKSTDGWKDSGNGTDDYGFSGIPTGRRTWDARFVREGERAYFWSITELLEHSAFALFLYGEEDDAKLDYVSKKYANAIRCVKNK